MTAADAGLENGGAPLLVGIGASAGGVPALQALFSALPPDSGAAFAVVMHLDPERRSELPQVIANATRMKVVQVVERQRLEPDCVYVIPPDRELQILDHEIAVAPFEEPRGQRSPIDHFFRSLADGQAEGYAVILSGAGADGTIGARAIKEAGGIVLVQDPAEAEYPSMPRSAIASGVADFVLPASEIAARLVDLMRGANGHPDLPDGEAEPDEETVRRILAHLRVRTGHDFSRYKRSTVLRRIQRRVQVTRAGSLRQYHEILRDSADEAQALLADMLISVTTFFRDGEVFAALQGQVIPELFRNADPLGSLRVWVPGCATGEEAYSIAMLLQEEASGHDQRPAIQVFGSDLDSRALAVAREGRYPTTIEADVSVERLKRFFVREGDSYRVRQELRDMVLFAVHDLLKDPPFSHVDLISCRNVLIYLDRELQEQVCGTFHYALKSGGHLVLGTSEGADAPAGLFQAINRNARIYRSTAAAGDRPRLLPALLGPARGRDHPVHLPRGQSATAHLGEAAMHRRALEKIAPPSILVDETHRVLHMSNSAGRFLQPSGGPLSGDISDLVRPEIRFELRSALNRLFEQGEPTLSLPILVQFNGSPHRVIVHVRSTDEDDASSPQRGIVMFLEGEQVTGPAVGDDQQQGSGDTVGRLTQELELAQARLRTVREESDAANEELRAANEELQSINEEYRSTAEELETSKEELQSINEELQTVNSELKLKLETISRAHSDLQNLMAATDVGTLFLDANFRIKRFTDKVTQLFSITPADEGRPITDFAHQLEYGELLEDARRLLAELTPLRREVPSRTGNWYDVRLRPYRTVDDKIDGVVLTFLDITERRHMEQALRESEELFRSFAEASPDVVWIRDAETLAWEYLSPAFEETYGLDRRAALGGDNFRAWTDLLVPEHRAAAVEMLEKARAGERATLDYQIVRHTDGKKRWLRSTIFPIFDSEGAVRRIGGIGADVTAERSATERTDVLVDELHHRTRNLITVIQSIALETVRHSKGLAEFSTTFVERLKALSRAQGLLSKYETEPITIRSLLRMEFDALGGLDQVVLDGPDVSLPRRIVQMLSLALHELATNARKYGALKGGRGTLTVRWQVRRPDSGGASLDLDWTEEGIETPQSDGSGYGRLLIERALPTTLGGSTRFELGNGMLHCQIELPLDGGD